MLINDLLVLAWSVLPTGHIHHAISERYLMSIQRPTRASRFGPAVTQENRPQRWLAGFLLAIGLVLGIVVSPAAATPVISVTGFTPNSTSVRSNRGWDFHIVATGGILATRLGFFDEGADGLAPAHDVGIFNPSGVLLNSATVAAGTVTPLAANGSFRLVDIVPSLLPMGNGYRIRAVYQSGTLDRQANAATGLVDDPSILFVQNRFITDGVAARTLPTSTVGLLNPGFFGPSFEIGAAAVSTVLEPSSLLPALSGGIGLLRCNWLRRRRAGTGVTAAALRPTGSAATVAA